MIKQSNSSNENVFLTWLFSCPGITDKNDPIPLTDRTHLLSKSRFMGSFSFDGGLDCCP